MAFAQSKPEQATASTSARTGLASESEALCADNGASVPCPPPILTRLRQSKISWRQRVCAQRLRWPLWAGVVLIAVLVACGPQTSPETDRVALSAFYHATGGPNWLQSSNWLTDTPLQDWYGVTTDEDGRVTGLELPANELSGLTPPELGNLDRLRKLDLTAEQTMTTLSGSVSFSFGNDSPSFSSQLEKAGQQLAESAETTTRRNHLSGCIPATLREQLDLDASDLGGLSFCDETSTQTLGAETGDRTHIAQSTPPTELDSRSTERTPAASNVQPPTAPSRAPAISAPSGQEYARDGSVTHVSWDPVEGADYYKVYHHNDDWCIVWPDGTTDPCEEIVSHSVHTSFTHGKPGAGVNFYWVSACDRNGCSDIDHNPARFIDTRPPAPANASYAWHNSTIVVSWDAAEEAEYYKVYYDDFFDDNCRVDEDGTPSWCDELATNITDLSYTHPDPDGRENHYWIRACNRSGCSDIDSENPARLVGPGPAGPPNIQLPTDTSRPTATPPTPKTPASDSVHRDVSQLCRAVNYDDVRAATELVDAGVDVNARCEASGRSWFEGAVPLHIAAGYDWNEMVQLLVDAGADTGARGNSPLCRAVNNGADTTVRILVESGADVNERCESKRAWYHGTNPIAIAQEYQWADILEVLRSQPSVRPPGETAEPSSDRDREALTRLYDATNGPSWTYSDNWLSDKPLGKWYGVTTDENGRVMELSLFDNGLSGPIPDSLAELDNLRWLDLSENQLTGALPQGLHHLSQLRWLHLSGNELTGPINPRIGDLSLLRMLALQGNQLTGTIPHELGELVNLKRLYLNDNQLNGEIPPELGRLSSLLELDLSENQLNGVIPPELGRLSSLLELDLSENQLNGVIPPELGRLSSLLELDLSENQLNGVIPPELGNLSDLEQLALYSNQLSGPIPPELGNLSDLEQLELQHNRLSGQIPPGIGNLRSLKVFAANSNQLSGQIPVAIGNLANLVILFLHDNQLSGEIPAAIGSLTGLRLLALHNNQLTGTLPDTVGNLTKLKGISVCGGNPGIVCNMTDLVAEGVVIGAEAIFGASGLVGEALGGTLGGFADALGGVLGGLGGLVGGFFGFGF